MSERATALRPWRVSAICITASAAFAIFDWSAFASSFPIVLTATVLIVGTVRWAEGEIARLEVRIEWLEQSDATLGLFSSDLPDA